MNGKTRASKYGMLRHLCPTSRALINAGGNIAVEAMATRESMLIDWVADVTAVGSLWLLGCTRQFSNGSKNHG